mmetsp:Transcript_53268/g.124855  ORF Transcript_53268/g.124855 Transcript_53268/m.124855 type:complete len:216 (-) Transcript_53268:3037-3684(-)
MEHVGRDVIGRTVGCVDHDLDAFERQISAKTVLAELDVAPARILQSLGTPQASGIHPLRRIVQRRFNGDFPCVWQFLAFGREELDAIVLIRVVRRADHHAQVLPQRTGQVSHTGRRQRPGQQHVHTRGRKPRFQRRLDHVAGNACVLANQNGRAIVRLAQHAADRMAQAKHEVRRDRILSNGAPNAVGPKILAAHRALPSSQPPELSPHRRRSKP